MKYTYNKARTRRTYIAIDPGWRYRIIRQFYLPPRKNCWMYIKITLGESFTNYKRACRAAREWREET